uniref:USP domain-containing protein n=2 Tax=Macrostomum lignano TaxID=282301 RepID=A0A1I8I5H8_9PLAT
AEYLQVAKANGAMADGDPALPLSSAEADTANEIEQRLLHQLSQLQSSQSDQSEATDIGHLLEEALQCLRDQSPLHQSSAALVEASMDCLVTAVPDQWIEKCRQLAGLVFRKNREAMVHSLASQVPFYARDAQPDRVILLLRVAHGVLSDGGGVGGGGGGGFSSSPLDMAFARCVRKNLTDLLRRCCDAANANENSQQISHVEPGSNEGQINLLKSAAELCDLASRIDNLNLTDSDACCVAIVQCLGEVHRLPWQLAISCLDQFNRLLTILWAGNDRAIYQSLEMLFAKLAACLPEKPNSIYRGQLIALSLRNVPIGIVPLCCDKVAEKYAADKAAYEAILDFVLHSLRYPGHGAVESGWLLYLLRAALRYNKTVMCLSYMRSRLDTVADLLISKPSRSPALTVFDFFVLTNRPGVELARNCLRDRLLPALSEGEPDTEALRDLAELAWAMRLICKRKNKANRLLPGRPQQAAAKLIPVSSTDSSSEPDDLSITEEFFGPVGSPLRCLTEHFASPDLSILRRRLHDHNINQLVAAATAEANAAAAASIASAASPSSAVAASSSAVPASLWQSPIKLDRVPGRLGLLNLGNTCYAGAAIQLLSACARLYVDLPEALAQVAESSATAAGAPGSSGSSDNRARGPTVSEHLVNLLRRMSPSLDSVAPALNPHTFLLRSRPVYMSHGSQQDSAEYLLHVIDSLIEEEKSIGPQLDESKRFVARCFSGRLGVHLRCKAAGHSVRTTAPFVTLHLALRKHLENSVSQMLADYLQPEMLAGDDKLLCAECNDKVEAEKQLSLQSLPNCLLLVLQLFHFDFAARVASKDTQSTVRLEPRIHVPLEQPTADEATPSPSIQQVPYRLEAFVVHHGMSLHSGHYTAVCRHSNRESAATATTTAQDCWIHANDDCVTKTSLSEWGCSGGGHYKTPYILLYVRDD